MSFSVLILTFNEEVSLPKLLARLRTVSDDIIVLDSCSSDATRKIALDAGCRVFERMFDNEKAQRTHGLSLPFRYEWVYNPDADEIPDDQLIAEMNRVSQGASDAAAFEVRFKNFFQDKWIKHSTDYPVWVVRFFRPSRLSFDREINLVYSIDGRVDKFSGHFHHFPFAKGVAWWIAKHNTYSTMEAKEALKVLCKVARPSLMSAVMNSRSAKERRIALKEWSFKLPLRGLLRFIYSYVMRFGFLDGRAGLTYCALISFYEFVIAVKIREAYWNDGQKDIRGI